MTPEQNNIEIIDCGISDWNGNQLIKVRDDEHEERMEFAIGYPEHIRKADIEAAIQHLKEIHSPKSK